MALGFRLVRRPRLTGPAQYAAVRRQVRIGLEPLADEIIRRYLNPIVDNWRNKPIFKSQIRVGPKEISIWIRITNRKKILNPLYGGTIGDLWKWINEGVKPHPIEARYKPYLVFQEGPYISKTGVGWYGGPGTRVGPFRRVRKIERHPGFKGRDFVGSVGQTVRLRFNRAVDAAYKRGLRRL